MKEPIEFVGRIRKSSGMLRAGRITSTHLKDHINKTVRVKVEILPDDTPLTRRSKKKEKNTK
jgi:hypothetical protein